jgi:hypothetical protein
LKITTDINQLLYSIKDLPYSAFRIEEKASGFYVYLLDSLKETVFELTEPLDKKMKAKISLALADFKKNTSHRASFAAPS